MTPHTHLIDTAALAERMAGGAPLALLDCSFELADPTRADALFAECRIAGARQAHLERHLSAPDAAGAVNGGRHPLPKRELLEQTLQALGIDRDMQVVAYDRNGLNFAGRAWWLLKWAGHDAVAVLDGGLQAWQAAGGAVESGPAAAPARGNFTLAPPLRRLVLQPEVQARLGSPAQTLIDARAPARFAGTVEPLDPVAGHIPGALNRPFTDNVGPDGRMKPPAALAREFAELLAGCDPSSVVAYCGSGVSAVPNVIALELAGLPAPALYAGSWSEWSRTPGAPVAQG